MLGFLIYHEREWRKSKKCVGKPEHNSVTLCEEGFLNKKCFNPPYSLFGARRPFIPLVSDFKLSQIRHKLGRIGFHAAGMPSTVEDSFP